MKWEMITAVATSAYTLLFLAAIFIAYVQVALLIKNGNLQMIMTIFNELQTKELMDTRRYIYENLPENIKGIDKNQLILYVQKAEIVFIAFSRVGYLMQRGHIDEKPIIENYWYSIWKCWKKSKNLIIWAREQRGDQFYLSEFEFLFNISESYRIQNGHPEPKLFLMTKIIK
ncbi:MAG: hypothetical protein HYT36_02410 [Candidatus Staskawiczbacteria bacterium]|nr:hypothetical protein [Candidatus Staskawiczbacteria bacterium]